MTPLPPRGPAACLRLLSLLFGARSPRGRDEAMASMQLYSTRREVTAVPQIKEAPAPLETARGVTARRHPR